MDFTFVCPTEILAFSERVKEFEALDTVVIGASTDSGKFKLKKRRERERKGKYTKQKNAMIFLEFSHLAWINTPRKQGGLGEMNIPLLADKTKSIAKDYGVLIEEAGVALRGLFIIDPKGIVRQITINDLPVGRDVEDLLVDGVRRLGE